MKQKTYRTLLSLFLAMTIFVMAGGVTLHRCACSGKISMTLGAASKQEGSKTDGKGCMTMTTVNLSPTTQVQSANHHFQVAPSLVAMVHPSVTIMVKPAEMRCKAQTATTEAYSPPPRQRLRMLRVLII